MGARSGLSRLMFFGASLLFVVAVVERLANTAGYTLIGQAYKPGRLLEFAAIMVLFVMTVLLREIRDIMKSRN